MLITVDIGGTNIRVAGVENLDNPLLVNKMTRRVDGTEYEVDIAGVVEMARKNGDRIEAVGVSVVGDLNPEKTAIDNSWNIPYWNNRPFAADLSSALGCSVIADNDAVAAALAEAYFDVRQTSFTYIVWGTGIGGAVVLPSKDNRLTINKLHAATYFEAWERECGGKKLTQIYGKPPEKLSDAEWQEVIGKFTARMREFVDKTRANALVFGGGLSVRHRAELEKLSDDLGIPIAVTNFAGDSGLYGGLALIKRGLE